MVGMRLSRSLVVQLSWGRDKLTLNKGKGKVPPFNLDPILRSFLLFVALMGYFWGWGSLMGYFWFGVGFGNCFGVFSCS